MEAEGAAKRVQDTHWRRARIHAPPPSPRSGARTRRRRGVRPCRLSEGSREAARATPESRASPAACPRRVVHHLEVVDVYEEEARAPGPRARSPAPMRSSRRARFGSWVSGSWKARCRSCSSNALLAEISRQFRRTPADLKLVDEVRRDHLDVDPGAGGATHAPPASLCRPVLGLDHPLHEPAHQPAIPRMDELQDRPAHEFRLVVSHYSVDGSRGNLDRTLVRDHEHHFR